MVSVQEGSMRMTYQLAMAAATDAGNRNMKQAGRSKWNQADYNTAVRELNRLWPQSTH
jgi:hypothetical protein